METLTVSANQTSFTLAAIDDTDGAGDYYVVAFQWLDKADGTKDAATEKTATSSMITVSKSDEAVIRSIAITTQPTKYNTYNTGDVLDTDGMKVTAYYSDGGSRELADTEWEVLNADRVLTYDAETPANNTVKYDVVLKADSSVKTQLSITVVVATSATITAPYDSIDIKPGETKTVKFTIDKNGSIIAAAEASATAQGNATVNMVKFTVNADGTVTITADASANPTTAPADYYEITVNGTAEDGSTGATAGKMNVEVVSAS